MKRPLSSLSLPLTAGLAALACAVFVGSSPGCAAGSDSFGGGDAGGGAPVAEVPVKGLHITDIDLYQAVQVPVARAFAPASTTIPVVAGKDTLVRVAYTLDSDFEPREVTVKLVITSGGAELEPIVATVNVSQSTVPDTLETSLNVPVPGASLAPDAAIRIAVFEANPTFAGSGDAAQSAWPAEGSAALNAQDVGAGTKLFVVPIKYAADGSNRLPDTSPEQVELYRSRTKAMYPTPDVVVEVTDPWTYNGPIVDPGGSGWFEILDSFSVAMHGGGSDQRAYYYGVFEPQGSFDAYCQFGCVTGLSYSSDSPGFDDARSSVGMGYPGGLSADTFVHELGHAHGVGMHSPCGGAMDTDPGYPYPGGVIGVLGMDVATQELKSPQMFHDIMGYCDTIWVSDYVYGKLFTRTLALKAPMDQKPGPERTYQAFILRGDGSLTPRGPRVWTRRPSGDAVSVRVRGPLGESVVPGWLLRVDHLAGGLLQLELPEGVEVLGLVD